MAKYDGKSEIQVVDLGTLTLSGVTPAASAYVDTQGFEAVSFVIRNNTVTDAGTAAGFTATLQASADTAAASAAPAATTDAPDGVVTVVVTSDAADDSTAGVLGYIGTSRYAGISITGTTATDADVTVLAILSRPHVTPTTAVGTKVART